MKRKSNSTGVIALLLAGAAGVLGVGYYVKNTPEAQNVPPAIRHAQTSPSETKDPASPSHKDKTSAVVLTPKSHGGELTFEKATEDVPDGTAPIVFAVNRYLENAGFVPAKARALSVEVKGDTAYIDFTEAMDRTYGSLDERTLLEGLCRAVGQFPDAKKVQFLVSGKPISSFGNVDLSQPIETIPPDDASTTHGA